MQYELFYLVGASKESDLDKIKSAVSNIVISEGGVFEEKQITEKRKLAYKVKHETHGFYVAQRFTIEETEKLRSLNKKLGLYPDILRSLISKTSELPELTTREERREKELSKVKIEPLKEKIAAVKKAEEKAVKPSAPPVPKKKPEVSDEDIDKKLEEILNI